MFKSGFVSIVGRPNVGKSTLLNCILETKLAIMSDVAQTTRNTIQGIYTDDQAQIIFMDTPGIHKPQDRLGTFMNSTALNSIFGVDLVLFLAPAFSFATKAPIGKPAPIPLARQTISGIIPYWK